MTDSLPQPCARWASLLAAHSDHLSLAERRALDAHVASCRVCAAVRADYRRMDARIRSLPDPRVRPDLPPWLLALQADEKRDASAPHLMIPFYSTEKHMHTRQEPGTSMPAPTPINQGRSLRRHVVSWVTAVAALAVIAVLTTAVLVSHTGKSTVTGTQGNQGNQGWTAVPGLTNIAAQPVLAPSNPQVIYLVSSPPNPNTLRRSDDGGAHWQNLTLPAQGSQADILGLEINPGDAQNVFLVLTFAQSSSACSSQASSGRFTAYSGNSCQFEYYSTDGGAQWGLTAWSAQAGRSGNPVAGGFVTQGNRLYSVIDDRNQNKDQFRLIASADDGATWQFADESLLGQGQGLCSFAAAPKDSSLFVLAQPGYCAQPVGLRSNIAIQPQAQSDLALWRSDDAGAHWSRVSAFPGPFPGPNALGGFSAFDAGGAQPTLFAAAGEGASYTVLMSTDGGKTWQPMPTHGIPAQSAISLPLTTLSDGSFLVSVQSAPAGSNGSGASLSQPVPTQGIPTPPPQSFYALNPGSQAWHQVAPSLPVFSTSPIVSSSAGGHDTLWVVTNSGGAFNVLYYTIP